MTKSDSNPWIKRPLSRDLYLLLRYGLANRKVLLILAAVLLSIGAWYNWTWLVAAGAAPLLLAVAPCAVMCLLGVCMHKDHGASVHDVRIARPGLGTANRPTDPLI